MRKPTQLISTIVAAMSPIAAGAATPPPTAASGGSTSNSIVIPSLANTPTDLNTIISSGVNTLIYVVGFISVIMVIVGGMMYALSAGDSGKAAKAKDTILYAVIGVAITLLAYSIVTFVVKKII